MDAVNDHSAQDDEVIELEPTMVLPSPKAEGLTDYATRHLKHVALVEGSVASLAGETSDLLKSRVAAAAIFLAVASSILFLWVLLTRDDLGHDYLWLLIAARAAIPAAVAAVLLTRATLTRRQLAAAEVVLFGGLTVILCLSQYFVNLKLMHENNLPGVIGYVKNGVIQMFALMVLYGMFIPNTAKAAARVVLSMALAPMLSLALLMERSDVAHVLEHMRTTEQAGSNALYLLLGAGLAIYGAHILSGMRTELHLSRRFGQYRLIRKLGQGGMGEVHLAEHELLKRPCALKLIRPESGTDPVALARFEREVQAAARLSHPNSIEIFDYGHADDGTFYYVMEYLPGMSLEDLVRKAGPLPPGRVIYLLRQVCAALGEAHSLGLIHRDLKPANIFVSHQGGESDVAKILDYGLVKLTRDPSAAALTRELTVSGTPSYMAPEQATGTTDIDPRADLYSIGTVAYFALTGQPPFTGESPFAILMAHARDPVVPPSQIQPGIPADLESVVLKCLAKSPSDRYPDARALRRALVSCSSASDWDSDQADAWWAAAESTITEPIEATA